MQFTDVQGLSERECVGGWWSARGLLTSFPAIGNTRSRPPATGAPCVHIMQACSCMSGRCLFSCLSCANDRFCACSPMSDIKGYFWRRQAAECSALRYSRAPLLQASSIGMGETASQKLNMVDTLWRDASSLACMEAYQVIRSFLTLQFLSSDF